MQPSSAEDSVLRYAVSRGYVTPEQVSQAQTHQARLAQSGNQTPLLSILRPLLRPEHLSELSSVYQRASLSGATAHGTPGPASPGLSTSGDRGPRPGTPDFGGRIGPFQVERELARGGMGVVYVARHVELGRPVALKLMLSEGLDPGDDALKRFEVEAQAVAKLKHPNIVALHEVGYEGTNPYLAMELIDGTSLKAKIATEGPLAETEAASVAELLADALAFAHSRSILHRDMKPHNVLIDSTGRPLITDFGLARDTSAEGERLTKTGEAMGTPAYMPPEQADGKSVTLDGRADVYSLGATLYEMLTGRPPFEGSPINVITKVLTKAPPTPRSLRPDLDADLEQIVLKAMEKEPVDRYPSAEAFAADLRRQQRGDPVHARPVDSGVRVRRWVRRNKAIVALLGVGALGLLAAAGWAVSSYREAELSDEHKTIAQTPGQATLQGAEEKLKAGEYGDAIREAKRALRQGAMGPRPHALVGDANLRWGGAQHFAAARAAYTLAIDASADGHPAQASAVLGRALACKALEDTSGALDDVNRAAALLEAQAPSAGRDQALLQAYALRSDVFTEAQDYPSAIRDLTSALALDDTPRRRLERTALYTKTGSLDDLKRAAADVTQILARPETERVDRDLIEGRLTRALIYCKLGRYESAMGDCEWVLALETKRRTVRDEALAHYCTGLVRFRGAKRDTRAVDDFTKAIDLDDQFADALAQRALARLQLLENHVGSDVTRADITRALAIDETNPYALVARASIGGGRRMSQDRLADCTAALARDPLCTDAYVIRARLMSAKGDFAAARVDCDRALDIDPGYLDAYQTRSRIRAKLGDVDGAIADCTRVIEGWHMNLEPWLLRAQLYTKLGRYEEALRDYDRALELNDMAPKGDVHTGRSGIAIRKARAAVRLKLGDTTGARIEMTERFAAFDELAARLDPKNRRDVNRVKGISLRDMKALRQRAIALKASDPQAALTAYDTFFKLWKVKDPERRFPRMAATAARLRRELAR